ncbi:MAG: hypothetical protein VKP62_11495 [Candidatus Sericytochromatia bacterium]|nr:hypothetical protein [Candidatus Sericytochromatia bacterium]
MPSQVLKAWLVFGLLLSPLTLASCQNTIENTAPVYPVLSGQVELRWDLDPGGVASVRYELNGVAIGSGQDVNKRFAVPFDTRGKTNGAHRLSISAFDVDGRLLRAFSATILIQN